jgi:L-threonylcarbamoyladenylate synthase
MTKIIDFKDGISEDELDIIKNSFINGKLVIFPTETVYGIGANALDKDAVNSIFKAKGRAQDNPLIVHISNYDMLKRIVKKPSKIEQLLIDNFMPGPFTLILKKKKIIPDNVTCGLDTVGIRYPEDNITHSIIEYTNLPIAAPSANISSKPSGTNIEAIKEDFLNKVDIIIDGGDSKIGLESTVCKVINGIPTILRPGKITPDDIKRITGKVEIDKHVFMNIKDNDLVESPGMKYKHYAPKTPCILIYGHNTDDFIDLVNKYKKDKTSIIGFSEHEKYFKDYKFHNLGSINNLDEIAKNVFTLLRLADKDNSDIIIIEGVKKEGLGIAIMNRLLRSVSFNYIEK